MTVPAVVTIFDLPSGTLSSSAMFEASQTTAGVATTIAVSVLQIGQTALTSLLAGTAGLPLLGTGSTTLPAFGVLQVIGGGVGTTTFPAFQVVVANGTAAFTTAGVGTTALPLVGNGTALPPSFQALTVPGGGLGTTTLTQNGVLFGNGSSVVGITAAPATSSILAANNGTPSFTTSPMIGTSVTVPIVVGGSSTTSTLTLMPTTAAGTTGSDIIFGVGTGGATQMARIGYPGNVTIGANAISTNAFVDINRNAFTTKALATSPLLRLLAANGTQSIFEMATFSSVSPQNLIAGVCASGTLAAPAVTPNNSIMFNLVGVGHDGSAYQSGGAVQVRTSEQWNGTSLGTRVAFLTTPIGSTIISINMALQASGGLAIGFNALSTDPGAGGITASGKGTLLNQTALATVGTAVLLFGSVASFGIYVGTGVPSVAAGTGSWFMRNDGATATTRMYINTNGTGGWTGVTTVT